MKLRHALVAAAVSLAAMTVQAQTVITMGTWLSPKHPQNAKVFAEWKTQLEAASDGKVTLELEYHNGHPKAIFDLVEDGTYDAGWSFHGYIPGRFSLTELAELPGVGAGAEAASVAYWRTYEQYLVDANEHDGLKVLGLFTHGPGQVQMTKPIDSLADLNGKKIRVGGGIQSVLAERMGITAVPAPGSKVYEILQQGVADGVFMPIGEQSTLRLSEVAKHVYTLPGGMYLGSFGIFMGAEFFDELDPAEQEALMSVSGENLSRLAGMQWEANDADGIIAAAAAGNEVVQVSDDDLAAFEQITADLDETFAKKVSGKGVDIPAALEFYRSTARDLE